MTSINGFFTGQYQPPQGKKPFLFCDSTWLIQYQQTDQALDQNGMPITTNDNGNMRPVAIQDIPAYNDELYYEDGSLTGYVPFWSPDLGTYFFSIPADGARLCRPTNQAGATQTNTVPFTMTLCMRNILRISGRDSVLGTK
jgi:hypothetical protein